MHTSLRNKTIVITGASSGVGRAAAEAFALEGAKLVLAARGKEALAETVESCERLGAEAIAVQTDVSKMEEVDKLVQKAIDFGGSIDVWVNNAGVLAFGKFDEIPADVTDQIIKTNLLGYVHGAHAVLPVFKKQGSGILINNISIGGWMPAPYGTAYTASKYGVRGLVEGLQAEVSEYPDIHICALYPGFQKSAGIQHAGNYSGIKLSTPPPAFDPRRLAMSMVKVAKYPVQSTYPDAASYIFKKMYDFFPGLVRASSAYAMRLAMKFANKAPVSEGNVLEASKGPMKVHGRVLVRHPEKVARYAGIAALSIAALIILSRSTQKEKR